MNPKLNAKLGDILIKIGDRIKEDPSFLNQLEKLLDSKTPVKEEKTPIDLTKIADLDLYYLAKHKSDQELESILFEFSSLELKGILKKYRFGVSPNHKTAKQIVPFVIHQVRQRTTDVFRTAE